MEIHACADASLDQRARLYLQSLPETGISWTGWHDHGHRDPAGRF